MYLDKHCPGCGQGEGNQSCKTARCSIEHGRIEYCSLCEAFPCGKYEDAGKYDVFITHRNYKKDFEKAAQIGVEAYQEEQRGKEEILNHLLENYNDGRRKTLFCLAVNLLELEELKEVVERAGDALEGLTLKEKAVRIAGDFQELAQKKGIVLKLNRKPAKNKK